MAYPTVFPHRRTLEASASGTGNTGKTVHVDIAANDAMPYLHIADHPEFRLALTPQVRTHLETLLADLDLGDA
jgi:hypothetical protein